MKIGIVTHQLLHNYGGTLQAFALQEVLRRMGHEPITIDYLPNRMTMKRYCLAQMKTLVYYLTLRRSRHFFPYPHIRRKPEFALFMNKYMNLTERVFNYKSSILKKYSMEALIVGSDQVWRGAFNPPSLQPDLYLRFAEKFHGPKIAYAASFGMDNWEYSKELTSECSKYAQLFTAISTREDSGVLLCNKYLKVKAKGVLDPTLLLEKEDYMEICREIPNHGNSYLLAYLLDMDIKQKEAIQAFADRNHLQPIFCTSEQEISFSVECWLALFRDASFVITNSFHGTVFSIINNKNFYSLVSEFRGTDRFVSLLSRFGLMERLLKDEDQLPEFITPIDWNTVNQTKAEWKEDSLDFLKSNL